MASAVKGGDADLVRWLIEDGANPNDSISSKTNKCLLHLAAEQGHKEVIEELVKAGADVAFLEGVTTEQEARDVCSQLAPVPVLLNMVEHGATPSWTPAQAKELGFRMMIFPFASIAPAYKAIKGGFTPPPGRYQ